MNPHFVIAQLIEMHGLDEVVAMITEIAAQKGLSLKQKEAPAATKETK